MRCIAKENFINGYIILTIYLTKLPFTRYQRKHVQFLKENLAAAFHVEFNDEVMQMETMITFAKVKCPFINITFTFEI